MLALAAMTVYAAPQAAPAKRPAAPSARSLAAPRLTDAQLEAAIKAKFAKSKIHEDKFTVRVQGGVAHIDGKTGVLQHKGVATRMAKTAGAVMVDNRVEVSQAAKDKAAGNLETGRRRVQVKRSDARSDDKAPK
jgi:BON domain